MDNIRIGDIILIDGFASQGNMVTKHSFVVIEDRNGEVCGLDYDFVALLMSSFKSDEQKKAKLKYPGNFPILNTSEEVKDGNHKDGFIKAEQFYYFNKAKTPYKVIGQLKPDTLEALFDFIMELPSKNVFIERIVDNL